MAATQCSNATNNKLALDCERLPCKMYICSRCGWADKLCALATTDPQKTVPRIDHTLYVQYCSHGFLFRRCKWLNGRCNMLWWFHVAFSPGTHCLNTRSCHKCERLSWLVLSNKRKMSVSIALPVGLCLYLESSRNKRVPKVDQIFFQEMHIRTPVTMRRLLNRNRLLVAECICLAQSIHRYS